MIVKNQNPLSQAFLGKTTSPATELGIKKLREVFYPPREQFSLQDFKSHLQQYNNSEQIQIGCPRIRDQQRCDN